MILKSISLQNFRNYSKAQFEFSPTTTIIIGPNAIGKSNIVEAIYLLSTGKSQRSDKQSQLIKFGTKNCHVNGVITESVNDEQQKLDVVLVELTTGFLQRRYRINGVSKRRLDFASVMPVVEFSPLDLDLVSGQPGVRRRFLDMAIESVDLEYRRAVGEYTKSLQQRNALLRDVQETGVRDTAQFTYWDDLLITNGKIISTKRGEFIKYANNRKNELFVHELIYDKSEITRERLDKYKNAEIGSGVTLVGPHRDDILIKSKNKYSDSYEEIKHFGSRGQQRLVALELKLAQISLINERSQTKPILLLDDVFSELDEENIGHVLELMNQYQTIATATHKEFINHQNLEGLKVIELE